MKATTKSIALRGGGDSNDHPVLIHLAVELGVGSPGRCACQRDLTPSFGAMVTSLNPRKRQQYLTLQWVLFLHPLQWPG